MSGTKLMIYGATGYTGRLVAAEAVDAGLRTVLAGRSAVKLEPMAHTLGLATTAFGLGDTDRLAAALVDIDVVLHCAGPLFTNRRADVRSLPRQRHALHRYHGGDRGVRDPGGT